MNAKLKMLKELLAEMHDLMAKGHGDDVGAGKEAMEGISTAVDAKNAKAEKAIDDAEDIEDGGADEAAEGEPSEESDDLEAQKKAFFGRNGKLPPPRAGLMVAMSAKAKPASKPSPVTSSLKKALKHG